MLRDTEKLFWELHQWSKETTRQDELYRKYLKKILKTFRVKRVSLMLFDETRQELYIHEAEGLSDTIKKKVRVKIGEGIAGWVAKKGESLLVNDIRQNKKFSKDRKTGGFKSGAFVSVPIKLRGKIYGVLNVAEKKPQPRFSREELKNLELLGCFLAILIENQYLSRQLEWLEQKPAEEIAQVSHDFRIPLICVQEVLQLMEKEELGPTTDAQKEFIELAKRNVRRMMSTFNELLAIATRTAEEQEKVEKVDGIVLLEEMVSDFAAMARRKRVRIGLDVPASCRSIETIRKKIYEVLMNLTHNALKHTPDGTDVILRLKAINEVVRFEVEDNGPGISPAVEKRLFDKKASLEHAKSQGMGETHGLGLVISRDAIRSLGGEIGYKAGKNGGSVFFVELPRNYLKKPLKSFKGRAPRMEMN